MNHLKMSCTLHCILAPLSQEIRHCSHQTEFPHSHPTESFPFQVSPLLEAFLEKWIDLFVEKRIIIMPWVGVCTIKSQGSSAGSGLSCSSGGAAGSLQDTGLGFFPNPSLGVCTGKGLVGQQWGGNAASLLWALGEPALTLGWVTAPGLGFRLGFTVSYTEMLWGLAECSPQAAFLFLISAGLVSCSLPAGPALLDLPLPCWALSPHVSLEGI